MLKQFYKLSPLLDFNNILKQFQRFYGRNGTNDCSTLLHNEDLSPRPTRPTNVCMDKEVT